MKSLLLKLEINYPSRLLYLFHFEPQGFTCTSNNNSLLINHTSSLTVIWLLDLNVKMNEEGGRQFEGVYSFGAGCWLL